jgi:hypothetical protein
MISSRLDVELSSLQWLAWLIWLSWLTGSNGPTQSSSSPTASPAHMVLVSLSSSSVVTPIDSADSGRLTSRNDDVEAAGAASAETLSWLLDYSGGWRRRSVRERW